MPDITKPVESQGSEDEEERLKKVDRLNRIIQYNTKVYEENLKKKQKELEEKDAKLQRLLARGEELKKFGQQYSGDLKEREARIVQLEGELQAKTLALKSLETRELAGRETELIDLR